MAHNWKKYSLTSTSAYRTETISGGRTPPYGSSPTWYAANSYIENNGMFVLINPVSFSLFTGSPCAYFMPATSGATMYSGHLGLEDYQPYNGMTGYEGYQYVNVSAKYVRITETQYYRGSYIENVTAATRNVYPDNNYSGNYWYVYQGQNPTAPNVFSAPANIQAGQSFTLSWSGAGDVDNNLTGYIVERSIDGGTTWQQIYKGAVASTTDYIALNITESVLYRIKAYDANGLESPYFTPATSYTVTNNTPPEVPASITVPINVREGSLAVAWAASLNSEGDLAGYKLERSIDSGETWTQIYDGALLSVVDTILPAWDSVMYRVRAYDTSAAHSAYITSPERTVNHNDAPVITCAVTALGDKSAGFSVAYSVDDPNDDVVEVTEKLDGVVKRTFTATLEASNAFQVTGEYFMQVLNGAHALSIEAKDSHGTVATHSVTFTKKVYELTFLSEPLTSDALIHQCVMSVVRSIPAGAEFSIELTNNAFDETPTWEDATNVLLLGLNYVFANQTVLAVDDQGNPKHGFAIKIHAARQDLGNGEYGQGGYISLLGGAYD